MDTQIEDLFKSKRSTKDTAEAGAQAPAPVAVSTALATAQAAASQIAQSINETTVADKLKLAKGIADRVSASFSAARELNADAARSFLGGGSLNSSVTVSFILSFD